MSAKDTLEKAYGNIPKEVNFTFIDYSPNFRSIKYYWYKLIRKFTR